MSTADLTRPLATWQDALARARDDFGAWKQDTENALRPLAANRDESDDAVDTAVTSAESSLSAIRHALSTAHTALLAAADAAATGQDADTVLQIDWRRTETIREWRQTDDQLADDGESLLVTLQAVIARALFEAASKEWNQPRPCRGCGGPVIVGAVWRPTTFTCDTCSQRTTFDAAPLTARFYGGHSLESICAEHAMDAWRSLRAAQRQFSRIAFPVPSDFEAFAQAARTWATVLCDLWNELDPHTTPERHLAAVKRRTEEALGESNSDAQQKLRARFAEGSTVAAGGDLGRLLTWATEQVGAENVAAFVSELAVSVHEHGDRTTAWQVIALEHHLQRIAEDRDSWMRTRLGALDSNLRLRA